MILKLFYKILFKCIEKCLSARTSLKYFFVKDKSKILLKYRDPIFLQQEIERGNKKELPLGEKGILIVIPFKDKWHLTLQCLKSLIRQKTEGLLLHVVLVNNNSCEEETQKGLEQATTDYTNKFATFKIENNHIPFNFSKLNNDAVKNFTTSPIDIILFLNNDIEFSTEDDLKNLVGFYVNTENIGALGCTLIYPPRENKKIIQHSFLAPGVKLVGAHPLKGTPLCLENEWFLSPRIVPCVTGAVFLLNYDDFMRFGGFDEFLGSAYQDLDLCLKIQQIGKVNWILPQTVLVHHETASRSKQANKQEIKYMYDKWDEILTHNRFYSRQYSRWSEQPIEALWEGDYPWDKAVL